MGRIWSSGAELASNTAGIEVDAVNGAATSVQNTTKRSGDYAYKVLNPASGTRTGWAKQINATDDDKFVRFYIRAAARPNVRTTIFRFHDTTSITSDSTQSGAIEMDTDGTLILTNWGSGSRVVIGSPSSALGTGDFYRVEIRQENASATNAIQARVDGSEFAGNTSLSLGGGANRCIQWGVNLKGESCTSCEIYFDDLAVNDSGGSVQNSYPGAGNIVHLKPNAAGDFAEGASGTGGSGYDDVDEVTPDDDTSYWILQTDSSANSGSADRLDVNVEAFGPSADSVTLVQVGVRAKPASNATCSFVPRIKSQASGTVVEGTTTSITGTAWFTNDDTSTSRVYKLTRYVDPQAGGAWTTTLLGTMQIGVRAPDGNPNVQISTLWALVEYVASAGGGAYTLTAATGSFTLTGNAAGLRATRQITAALGTFALTGVAAGLYIGRKVIADVGTFTLTGNAAGLLATRLLTAETGGFVFTGNAAGLNKGFTLTAATGVFVETGNDAGLRATRLLTANSGTFTLTGNDASLRRGRTLTAESGAFVLTGNDAGLRATRLLTAERGTYTVIGVDAGLRATRLLTAETGTFTLTGFAASLLAARHLTAERGVFTLTGNDAGLTFSGAASGGLLMRRRRFISMN